MKHIFLLFISLLSLSALHAQELNAKVVVNTAKISNTKKEVFDALKEKMEAFLNERRWTQLEVKEVERISMNMNLTVNKWDEGQNLMECTMMLSSSRPVYGSSYSTTLYNVNDADFNFNFQTTDQLTWNPDNIDNNLTALLAYYAYIILGYDMDSMSPMGGTAYLQQAEDIVTKAQNLGFTGWQSFNDPKNRFGLLNDYMDGSMEGYRQLIYQYHRKGLDQMSTNVESGRQAISQALELLDQVRHARAMSQLPILFCETKRDELINIYQGKDTREVRNRIYDILFGINPSMSEHWDKIKN